MIPGWILSLLVLAPNLLMLIFRPVDVPPPDGEPAGRFDVLTGVLERVGQAGCFVLPFFYRADSTDPSTLLALEFMLAALGFYFLGWARYLRQGRRFSLLFEPMWGVPLPMAVAPVAYFFAASFALRSWALLAAAVALAIGHLAVSAREWRRCRGWNGSCNSENIPYQRRKVERREEMRHSRTMPMPKGYPPKGYPNPYQYPYSNQYQNPQPKPRFRLFHFIKRVIYWSLIAFVILGVSGTIFGFVLGRSLIATQGLAHLLNLPPIKLPGILASLPALQPPSAQPAAVPTPLPWNGKTRVTALVMGLDYRDWENGDVPRSDSMWLLTVDPVSKTGGMMSIPRDMWVDIPGYGPAKINMAYFFGEVNKLPGGGPALAAKTVEKFLDVKVNYTVVIDFTSFVKFIDKLDGVWIDVPEEITVDPLGPGNTVILQPGRQRLMGDVALAYARMRYTNDGDFDRMKRQMQVIMAVRERVMDPKYLPLMVAHAGEVYDLISSGVRTNLTLQEAIQLAWLAKDVTPDRIKNAVIDHNMVTDTYSPEGWAVLVPDMNQIHALRDQIFPAVPVAPPAESPAATPQPESSAPSSPAGTVQSEAATVAVQNGTETIGLARRTTDYLASLGLSMADPTDAEGIYNNTTIIDYSGKKATVAYIAGVMHVSEGRILSRSDPNPPADIVVIAGNDWVNENSMP